MDNITNVYTGNITNVSKHLIKNANQVFANLTSEHKNIIIDNSNYIFDLFSKLINDLHGKNINFHVEKIYFDLDKKNVYDKLIDYYKNCNDIIKINNEKINKKIGNVNLNLKLNFIHQDKKKLAKNIADVFQVYESNLNRLFHKKLSKYALYRVDFKLKKKLVISENLNKHINIHVYYKENEINYSLLNKVVNRIMLMCEMFNFGKTTCYNEFISFNMFEKISISDFLNINNNNLKIDVHCNDNYDIILIMYNLIRKSDLESGLTCVCNNGIFNCFSGFTSHYDDILVVSKNNDMLGLLTHEMCHLFGLDGFKNISYDNTNLKCTEMICNTMASILNAILTYIQFNDMKQKNRNNKIRLSIKNSISNIVNIKTYIALEIIHSINQFCRLLFTLKIEFQDLKNIFKKINYDNISNLPEYIICRAFFLFNFKKINDILCFNLENKNENKLHFQNLFFRDYVNNELILCNYNYKNMLFNKTFIKNNKTDDLSKDCSEKMSKLQSYIHDCFLNKIKLNNVSILDFLNQFYNINYSLIHKNIDKSIEEKLIQKVDDIKSCSSLKNIIMEYYVLDFGK